MRNELLTYKDPKSPVSEVFRTLRTNIQFMNTNRKMKTLLVTSTFPAEGKSWITSNLAVTFAQAGKRVILIDADMRKGRQFKIFDLLPKPGLSNYLSNMDSENMEIENVDITNYIQETRVENLHVLVAGNVPPNPSELLVSTRMRKLLQELKEMCDLIIIDGTPCDLVTDSIILSRFVDSTIIVTAQKETKKDNLERIVKNIRNVGGRITGVVVNKVDISAKKYSQQYYYGSISANNISKPSKHNKKLDDTMSNIFDFLQKDDKDKLTEDIEDINQENEQIKTLIDEFTAIEDDNKNKNYSDNIKKQEKIENQNIQNKFEPTFNEKQNVEKEQNNFQETKNVEPKVQYNTEQYSKEMEPTITTKIENQVSEVQTVTYEPEKREVPEVKEETQNKVQTVTYEPENNEVPNLKEETENSEIPEVKEKTQTNNYQNFNQNENNSYNRKHKNKYRIRHNRKEKNKDNNNSNIEKNDYNKIYNYDEDNETNNYEQHKNETKVDSQPEQLNNNVELAESAKNMSQDKANEIINLVNSYIESEKQKQERKY